jgi:hypothetical protein
MIISVPPPIFLYWAGLEDDNVMKTQFNEVIRHSNFKEEVLQAYPKDTNMADVDGFFWSNFDKHPTVMYALVWHSIWFSKLYPFSELIPIKSTWFSSS